MILLNYIYFLIISYFGVKFLFSRGGIVKSPFDKDVQLGLDGPEMFWCLTFATGLIALSAPGALDLMAIRLLVLEVLCIVGLTVTRHKPVWSLPLIIYGVYLAWIIIGCFYGSSMGYGIRVVMKYVYPLVLCLFASAAVRHREVFIKSSLLARTVAVVSVVFAFVPYIAHAVPGVFWYGTARAINYISIMVLSIGLFYFTDEKRKNLLYAILFILPCFLWVFRTSIMGSMVAIMAFCFMKYRLRSLPIIFGIVVLGVVAVFTIPSLRNKMFHDKNVTFEQFRAGKVDDSKINTNARSLMWETLQEKFYEDNKLTGSGTGAVQKYMYTHRVFGGLTVPHSDFVQMKCDNGLIGLILYVLVVLLIYFDCFRTYWNKSSTPSLKLNAIVAGASMAGVFVTLYSDNTVNFSMATLSMPFGFYGMMLGLKS